MSSFAEKRHFASPNTSRAECRSLRIAALRSSMKSSQPQGCCGFIFVASLALHKLLRSAFNSIFFSGELATGVAPLLGGTADDFLKLAMEIGTVTETATLAYRID